MKFGPVEIKDKAGRTVVLRNAEASDAEALIQYLKTVSSETPYLIREPDEVTLTIEQEKGFIEDCIASDRSLMLVAAIDGRHVGNCSLSPLGTYRRYAHRCEVAIALYKEYCGMGIGQQMLNAVLDAARQTGYEQAELEVISDNSAAIDLYEKLGFVKYGELPNNMKYADGRYANAYWMMKKL